MTPRFVLAMGRSGTMWVAAALTEAGGLDARHESAEKFRQIKQWGDVEVNSFLWEDVRTIRSQFGETTILHLVRDGRDVVRSVLNRQHTNYTLEQATEMWRRRNHYLRKLLPDHSVYRLEDLTTRWRVFREFCERLGSPYVRRWAWERLRAERINPNTKTPCPPFAEWAEQQQATFWAIAEGEMGRYHYGDD